MHVPEGHLMMTPMKPNHSNHLVTVYKHAKAPPTKDVAAYNPSSLKRYVPSGSRDCKLATSLVEVHALTNTCTYSYTKLIT